MVLVTPYQRNKLSVTLLIFFLLIHAVITFDFGFMKRKSVASKIAIKIFTLLQCIGVCVLTLCEFALPENEKEFVVIGVYLIIMLSQYVYNNLVLTFSYESSFYVLLKTLLYADDMMSVDSKIYNTEFILICSWSIICFVRIIDMLLYCVYFSVECSKSTVINIMLFVHIILSDTIYFMLFMLFYTVYCRLKKLSSIVQQSTRRIMIYITVYKTIVDSVEKTRRTVNYLYIMALINKVTELTGTVYLLLLNIKEDENMFVDDQFVRSVYTIQVIVLLFLPSIAAGSLTAEAEKLKIIIYEKLMQELDEDRANILELFAEYVEARPLRLRMVKVVPLDWTLPILITDFIISHQIIIVQLTNLF